MPNLPDANSLEALRAYDTPTICNALEIVAPGLDVADAQAARIVRAPALHGRGLDHAGVVRADADMRDRPAAEIHPALCRTLTGPPLR